MNQKSVGCFVVPVVVLACIVLPERMRKEIVRRKGKRRGAYEIVRRKERLLGLWW
jgi:hypothetical protein